VDVKKVGDILVKTTDEYTKEILPYHHRKDYFVLCINYLLKKKYRENYSLTIVSVNIVVRFPTLRQQHYTHIWELGITTTMWYKKS